MYEKDLLSYKRYLPKYKKDLLTYTKNLQVDTANSYDKFSQKKYANSQIIQKMVKSNPQCRRASLVKKKKKQESKGLLKLVKPLRLYISEIIFS